MVLPEEGAAVFPGAGADELLPGILEATGADLADISYSLVDYEAFYYDALTEALANARERAETIAAAAGVRLGAVIEVSEETDPDSMPHSGEYDSTRIVIPAYVRVRFLIG